MNIVIRTDASFEIGTGHVMRCLTLAGKLIDNGAAITFICRDLSGNFISYIKNQGINVETINENENDLLKTKLIINSFAFIVDLLIVDHYAIDVHWESKMRQLVKKIMVIDDLANRQHDCDLLLDQNYYINTVGRYENLVPKHCKLLLGPQYILLRDEFIEAAKNLKTRSGRVNRILVFFGGSDPTNETEKALNAIKLITNKYDIIIDVVVGNSNHKKMEIKEYCSEIPQSNFFCQVENIAELMANADLSIGASGAATWERCFLQLPTLTIVIASNQAGIAQAVATKGATVNLGESQMTSIKQIQEKIIYCIENPAILKEMSNQCIKIIDSKNVMKIDLVKEIQEVFS